MKSAESGCLKTAYLNLFGMLRKLTASYLFLTLLFLGLVVIVGYLCTTTYSYVVKANAQYVAFQTIDQQMQWGIQGFSVCEESSYAEDDFFDESELNSKCSFELNSIDSQRTSKFLIFPDVRVTISWIEGAGLVANLYHPANVGEILFFSDPKGPIKTPVSLKGNVRLTLDSSTKSHELLLYGTKFEVGQLPAVGSVSSLKEGVLEAYGAREFLQSYRYLISTEMLSQGSAVKLFSPSSDLAGQANLYVQGFLRVGRQSEGLDHFYIRLSPPYKYDGSVQKVLAEVAEFGGESKLHKPNVFEVIQRDNHLAIIITFFAIFIALATLARALMDLRDLFK